MGSFSLEVVSTASKNAVNRTMEMEIQKWKHRIVHSRWNCEIIIWRRHYSHHGMVVQLQLSDYQQSVPKRRAYVNDLQKRFKNRLLGNELVF